MYMEFYGLEQRPFRLTADPDFLFMSEGHGLALSMLRYGVSLGAPLTVVTGEIGSGKTTLLRRLMAEIEDDVTVGLVSNMHPGHGELLHWVLLALDRPVPEGEAYVRSFQRLQDALVETYASGRRTVLVFDEAQNFPPSTLEELRMLSNINAEKDELLQIILVGQPELRDVLRRPELAQFVQRISADFHLEPLTRSETHRFIHHRLAVAGAQRQIFEDRACDLVYDATGGVPRMINTLCDLALVYGFSDRRGSIGPDLVRDLLAGVKRHGIYQQFRPLEAHPQVVGSGQSSTGTG